MRRALFSLMLLGAALPALAGGAGTSGAQVLKQGAGARAAAMGEAFVAVADDATALFWNPAALTSLTGRSAALMHAPHIESSYFSFLSYAQPLANAAWAAGIQHLSMGSINSIDLSGNPAGSVTPADTVFSGAYARKLSKVSLGLTGKFVQSKIVDTASTFAMDLGALSPDYLDGRLRLGLAVTNVGGSLKYDGESSDLPMTIRAGTAYRPAKAWLVSADLSFPRDNDVYAALGGEFRQELKGTTLAYRAGYNTRSSGDGGGLSGPTFGFGLGFQKMSFDYGLLTLGDLGLTHRISLSYSF